jgi:hypothetical protein
MCRKDQAGKLLFLFFSNSKKKVMTRHLKIDPSGLGETNNHFFWPNKISTILSFM